MSTSPAATPRPSVVQLAIKEKAALYAAYIPMFADGGIFIPTTRDYKLGDDVYVLHHPAGRPAALPDRRQSGVDHPGAGSRQPHPGRRRALPGRREIADAQDPH